MPWKGGHRLSGKSKGPGLGGEGGGLPSQGPCRAAPHVALPSVTVLRGTVLCFLERGESAVL